MIDFSGSARGLFLFPRVIDDAARAFPTMMAISSSFSALFNLCESVGCHNCSPVWCCHQIIRAGCRLWGRISRMPTAKSQWIQQPLGRALFAIPVVAVVAPVCFPCKLWWEDVSRCYVRFTMTMPLSKIGNLQQLAVRTLSSKLWVFLGIRLQQLKGRDQVFQVIFWA